MVLALGLGLLACKGEAKQGSAAQRSPTAGSTGFNGSAAYSYAKAQVDFGPRVPGTPAAQRAGDWIIRQMRARADTVIVQSFRDRKSTRLNSSHSQISYAVFCLKK